MLSVGPSGLCWVGKGPGSGPGGKQGERKKREQRESDSSPGGDGVVSQVNIDTAYVPHAVCAVLSHFSHV